MSVTPSCNLSKQEEDGSEIKVVQEVELCAGRSAGSSSLLVFGKKKLTVTTDLSTKKRFKDWYLCKTKSSTWNPWIDAVKVDILHLFPD